MKTANNYFDKFYGLIAFVLLTSFVLTSCANKNHNEQDSDGGGIRNPVASENPVNMTSVAESKTVWVTNLSKMSPQNETDKFLIEGGRMVVENDWITITATHEEGVKIEVKENTSDKSRTYSLRMSGKPGEGTLTINQAGKQ